MTLDSVLFDIVSKNLANKMSKSDPEYKNFKESYDKVLTYFSERFKYIADELVYDIFSEINDRVDEIVNVLSRNMLDFCDLVKFFSDSLGQINPMVNIEPPTGSQEDIGDATGKTKNTFQLITETLAQLADKLLNSDPQQTEIYFLEYGLDELLEIMQ